MILMAYFRSSVISHFDAWMPQVIILMPKSELLDSIWFGMTMMMMMLVERMMQMETIAILLLVAAISVTVTTTSE